MIFLVIRIALLLLRRAGYNAPQMPTLRQRPFLFEQLLDPATRSTGGSASGLGGFGPRRFISPIRR